MKLLTLNFVTCARKSCKTLPAAFPLHPRDAELEIVEMELNPKFLVNILPRVEWQALRTVCQELGLPTLPDIMPVQQDLLQPPSLPGRESESQEGEAEGEGGSEEEDALQKPSQTAQDLHRVLLETTIANGKLVCGACGHEYAVKEGIANFLLPSHMV
ncbi:Trm112p-domain-containing protein [Viridothelium virens]|uniref:Trm112p-domain-containing protein n=1 Tax=Viridothelium virens TaxID=1048519 RepID=A0A6A6HJ90_VIRVR|nr:Trm112p-domain-containing protein [Viridothelium virens]